MKTIVLRSENGQLFMEIRVDLLDNTDTFTIMDIECRDDSEIRAGIDLKSLPDTVVGMKAYAEANNVKMHIVDQDLTKPNIDVVTSVTDLAITTSGDLPDAPLGSFYSQQVLAEGGNGQRIFSVTNGTLPTGLVLDARSGYILGIPSNDELQEFDITVVDEFGQTDVSTVSITAGTISILARQFDGIDDDIQKTGVSIDLDSVNWKCTFNYIALGQVNEATLFGVSTSTRFSVRILTDGRIKFVYGAGTTIITTNSLTEGVAKPQIVMDGADIVISTDEWSESFTQVSTNSNTVTAYIGSNIGGLFIKSEIISQELNGVIYAEATNWQSGTIDSPILVESTNGGTIWSPV